MKLFLQLGFCESRDVISANKYGKISLKILSFSKIAEGAL